MERREWIVVAAIIMLLILTAVASCKEKNVRFSPKGNLVCGR